jgi:pimeloyl-ACP methyl ester carboxylesterase
LHGGLCPESVGAVQPRGRSAYGNGAAAVTPSWPDDPETIDEARAHPEVFAGKTLGQVADHVAEVIEALTKKPVVMGHSTGGLLAQMIADRGLSAATVAIDPGPFRGVLPLPVSALRSAAPVQESRRGDGGASSAAASSLRLASIGCRLPWESGSAAQRVRTFAAYRLSGPAVRLAGRAGRPRTGTSRAVPVRPR